ncbi:MAG: hypothetical protein A2086_03260 [Spirochaetes bacterium GWD1_27_9]|nr:MAG: hypothetical protein A2Z98_12935 [Spirochaetes bacterium GWB1_27_13]OHD26841.1 MAG: hypothetical protein A2Y34_15750 [Spirochaetes bacterium GWC1_27_15]OHD38716.1 MAG: hypothetical protein A2086_03260 [Spirochaetes bacterium GWD1_27_9]
MKSQSVFKLLLLFIIIILVASLQFISVSCVTQATTTTTVQSTYKISGSLNCNYSPAYNKNVYLGLFNAGSKDFTITPIYGASTILNTSGKGNYLKEGIISGTYACAVFVDINNNGKLDTGDYVTYKTSGITTSGGGVDIIINGDYTLNIDTNMWCTY